MNLFEYSNNNNKYIPDPVYHENRDFLETQLITYIGNKRRLLSVIDEGIYYCINKLGKNKVSIFDGFSGSGIVSRNSKRFATSLYVNDLELYSSIINKCYLSNRSLVDYKYIKELAIYLNQNKLRKDLGMGFIEELYAPKDNENIQFGERVFYTNTNARIIDNIRRMVEHESCNYFFIAPLLSEASVHANTSGVFKGFYKNSFTKIGQFGGNAKNCLNRIKGEITLPIPIFSNYECDVNIYQKDTNELVNELPEIDIAYYDPPYNQHPYGSNYFMLDLIASYKKPQKISYVSGIPRNWNKSDWNYKEKAEKAFEELIENTKAKFILISYNNEGIIPVCNIKNILQKQGNLDILDKDYPAFKGSRNLKYRSRKVKEFLFILEKK